MEEPNVTQQRTQEEAEDERTNEASKEPEAKVPPVAVQETQFQKLEPTPDDMDKDRKLDLLMDLSLPVSIELGRTSLLIRDILDLKRGQVVEFEKLASEPVDVLVNGKKMAEGEVVVIEKHFGIRITHLVETSERIKGLGK
ncbi:MAG: flagellar motor switch protein FliN [Ignavibacteria bacterium]|nr:flagellar motor switch protein FliN [Ignavibacteria bacterium]